MSHSTQVRVSVGMIALEFTYGSAQIAERLEVVVGHKRYAAGETARNLLKYELAGTIPDADYALILLIKARHEDEFSNEDRVDYAMSYNDIHVTISHHD